MATDRRWLLLIHQVPPKPDYLRVKVRRRLQRIGAVLLKNTVYALPRSDQTIEDFEWVLREITKSGGQGAIVDASFVGGLSEAEVEGFFREARASDYRELSKEARAVLRSARAKAGIDGRRAEIESALGRLRVWLDDIGRIDFLGAPQRTTAEALLRQIGSELDRKSAGPVRDEEEPLMAARPRGRTWVTRTGVYVDRIASAWLIRRFIDPKARFKFVSGRDYQAAKAEIRFDMFDAEYTHDGEMCTFEVLLDRFRIDDPALAAIAELVHDLDMKDDKFRRSETAGFGKVIAGIAMAHKEDDARIERGSAVLDDLYVVFSRKSPRAPARGR